MVHTIIQNILVALSNFALQLPEPDPTLLATITNTAGTINDLFQQIHNISFIFPLQTLIVVISTMIALEFGLFLFGAGNWLLRIITLGIVK
jgi:hypothetical protein